RTFMPAGWIRSIFIAILSPQQMFIGAEDASTIPALQSGEHANNGDFSMILGMSVGAFTILHVIITLVAIGSGLIAVGGMFASNSLPVTTALFLFTTALTSLTGFLFPIHGFTPALGVGIVACVILAVALFALYKEHLLGAWRWIYVITAVVSLYLNVFVLVVQSFVKVSALNALAPTQTEPPFAVTQATVLAIFILIALIAVIKFRPPKA